jgi:hypothetical protein
VEAAYSLRKLRAAYTGFAIKVRRNGDNATQNIGFTATGALDETALTTFVTNGNLSPTNSGTVSIWYDQSGKGRDVANTTTGEQPFIVTSGIIEKYNGLPTVKFVKTSITNSTNQSKLYNTTSTPSVASAMGIFAYTYNTTSYQNYDAVVTDVTNLNGTASLGIAALGTTASTNINGLTTAGSFFWYKNKVPIAGTSTGFSLNPISSLNVVYTENWQANTATNNWGGVQLGSDRNLAGRNWGGPISEVILFNSRLNDNSYADVLTIQDAQMLYFLGK